MALPDITSYHQTLALGAGRSRVVRQLLTESLVLSLAGGALGLVVGAVIVAAAPSVVPPSLLPPTLTPEFDLRVVGFSTLAVVLVGVISGLVPAWQSTTGAGSQTIAAEGRSVTGHGGRLRSLLVVAEVATAVLLLFGAGQLLRTLNAVDTVDAVVIALLIATVVSLVGPVWRVTHVDPATAFRV